MRDGNALILLAGMLPFLLGAAQGVPMGLEIKTHLFGVLALTDGELAAMDGGTHGVSGHTARVLPDGTTRWERRIDTMGPSGREGGGVFSLDARERAQIARWAEAAWKLGDPANPWPPRGAGEDDFLLNGPPHWVWAVLVRRGAEIRAVQGDTWTGSPEELRPLLDWLQTRVDAASEAQEPPEAPR